MDTKEVWKRLRGLYLSLAWSNAPKTCEALKIAMDALEQQEKDDWKNGLPEKKGEYIVEADGAVFSAEYLPMLKTWVGTFSEPIKNVDFWKCMPTPKEKTV